MKRKSRSWWLKRGLIAVILLVLISPCALCISVLHPFFRSTLLVFPGAEEVSNAYHFYGSDTGIQTIYFWTSKPFDDVKQYYETLAAPFVLRDYRSDLIGQPYYHK